MLYLKKNQREVSLQDIIRILRMFLLIDLPGELPFPFNTGIKQETNTTLVANLIAKHYGEFK